MLRQVVGDYTKCTGSVAGDTVTVWAASNDVVEVIGPRGKKQFVIEARRGGMSLVAADSEGIVENQGATITWRPSGAVWRRKAPLLDVGPNEKRDAEAVPLASGQREGRATYVFRDAMTARQRRFMSHAERILEEAVPPHLLSHHGNVYYPSPQGKWRGHAGYVYYPPCDAYKVCLAGRRPSHQTHRNVYHGTTLDRVKSILQTGLQLSGTGEASAQNPYKDRHEGRIFTSPQFDTSVKFAKWQKVGGCEHRFKVVLKCLQRPDAMVPLGDPASCGFDVDGDFFYTVEPASVCVFSVMFVFDPDECN